MGNAILKYSGLLCKYTNNNNTSCLGKSNILLPMECPREWRELWAFNLLLKTYKLKIEASSKSHSTVFYAKEKKPTARERWWNVNLTAAISHTSLSGNVITFQQPRPKAALYFSNFRFYFSSKQSQVSFVITSKPKRFQTFIWKNVHTLHHDISALKLTLNKDNQKDG